MAKVNVKKMDFVALSEYNVASVEIVRLTTEKSAELKPLADQRKTILAERTKALAEDGAVLDDVLRKFSVDKIDAEIQAVNFKYAEPLRECAKAQNKVLKMVPGNIFYGYAVSMESLDSLFNATGEFTYEKKNGEHETVKVGSKDTFLACIKSVYADLGATGLDDKGALDKVVKFHAKRIGGLKFDRKTQKNVLKRKAEITNGLVRDIIAYLEVRGTITVADDGSITVA